MGSNESDTPVVPEVHEQAQVSQFDPMGIC